MIRGVTKIIRSRRFSVSLVKLNSLPMIGRLPRSGMPDRVLVTWVTVRPPMTAGLAVVDQELVVGLLLVEDEAEVRRGQRLDAERSVWSCIRIWRLLVTCGVTVRRIPVSLNCTLARAVPPRRSSWRR